MRKINFLFAFLLSMMGATQAWAETIPFYSYSVDFTDYNATTVANGKSHYSAWEVNGDSWNFYNTYSDKYGFYCHWTETPSGTCELVSPQLFFSGTNDVIKVKCYRYDNSGENAFFNIYVSSSKSNWGTAVKLYSGSSISTGVDNVYEIPVSVSEGRYYVKLECQNMCVKNFNVEGAITRNESKMFVDFTNYSNSNWPEDWSHSSWYIDSEKAAYTYSTNVDLISPQLTFSDGETVYFNVKRYSTSSYYTPALTVYTCADLNWTSYRTHNFEASQIGSGWTTFTVSLNAEEHYICFRGSYIDINNVYGGALPDIPEMKVFSNSSATTEVTNNSTLDFGFVTEAPTYTYYVKNTKRGSLTVNVTTTESCSVNPTTMTLAAGEQQAVTITPSSEATVTFIALNGDEEIGTTTLNFTGLLKDDSKFFEDFNGTSMTPVEGIDGWDIDVTTHEGAEDLYGRMQYYDDNGTSVVFYYVTGDGDTPAYLITPKLHVNGTDDTFYLRTGGISDGKVTVSYSADMNSWTEISNYASIGYTNKSFNNIPEGDYYIKIELWDGTIDYFYGFQLAQDEPATGMNIYMKANGWAADNARMLAWYWGEGNKGAWSDNLTAVEGEEDIYTVSLPEGTTGLKFVRKSQDSALGWGSENNWNESANDIDVYDGAYYTMTGFDGFKGNDPIYGYYEQELTEAAENTDAIHVGTHHKMTVAFTMQAGKFAAICLPFATTTTALGKGVKAWAFTGFNGNVNLETTTELAAATPYVIYAANGISGLNFQNVNIESAEAGYVVDGDAIFQGSYVKMAAGTMMGKYGVTPAGKIQKAGSGASMKAFRAYFDGISQGAKLVCDGEIIGEATGIDTIENAAQAGELYDLQGRRVMNAQKGLYIQNGKKFVVK